MVELLSEFESNASSLLMKHRDHYSHSVYVFALGLAIYEMNAEYRKTFSRFYDLGPADGPAAAAFFLAALLSPTAFGLAVWSETIIPIAGAGMAVVIPAAALMRSHLK